MASGHSTRTVIASIIGTTFITVTKFAARAASGSASMIAEGIHSLVDLGNRGLMYLGLRCSSKAADELHPFGYGMELYFWTLIVAVLMVAIGG